MKIADLMDQRGLLSTGFVVAGVLVGLACSGGGVKGVGGDAGVQGNSTTGAGCMTGDLSCACYNNLTCNGALTCNAIHICESSATSSGNTTGSGVTGATTGGTTSGPGTTTSGSDTTTSGPGTTTSGPGTTTSGPGTTTSGPGTTTSGPGTTTSGPGTTTSGPGTTTSGPGTTTSGPGTTTSGPGTTTSGPGTTTSGVTTGSTTVGTTTSGTTGGVGSLTVTDTDWVARTSNPYDIQGSFWPYGDSLGLGGVQGGDCQAAGFAASSCSSVNMTIPSIGMVCASGTAARVPVSTSTGTYAYSAVWGAGIGFTFNQTSMDSMVASPYDATSHGVTGVSFTIDSIPASTDGIRVQFPATGQEKSARYIKVTAPGTIVARFANATVGYDPVTYPGGPVTSALLSVEWQAVSNISTTVPFSFCITNFKVLTN